MVVATSGVNSVPTTPRMSYSRKIAGEIVMQPLLFRQAHGFPCAPRGRVLHDMRGPNPNTERVHTERIRDGLFVATCALYTVGLATYGLVALLLVAAVEGVGRTWRWVPTVLDRPLVGFGAAALLSATFSQWRRDSLVLSGILIVTLWLSVRTTAAFALGGAGRSARLLQWWVGGGLVAALLVVTRSDPTGAAPAATPWLGSNGAGTTLAIAAVMAMGLLPIPAAPRWVWLAGLALLLAGLVGTWSRSAWLGTLAGAAVTWGLRPRPRLAAVLLMLALAASLTAVASRRWPELAAEVRSIASLEANRNRIVIWTTVPKMIADRPILGTGYGTFVRAYQRYRPPDAPDLAPPFAHNLLLNTAVEMGLVGLAALVALCGAGLVSAWRWVRRSPQASPERAVATSVLAALVTLLVIQMVDGTVASVHIGFGFFALLALAATGGRATASSR
jgi:hypothetical protein